MAPTGSAMPLSTFRCVLGIATLLLLAPPLAPQELWPITFEDDQPQAPPSGFSLAAMRRPGAGRRPLQRAAHGNFLPPRAAPPASAHARAIANAPVPDDLAVSVRLRMQNGNRAGGLVWRYQDDRNYYTLLLDLDRGELAVYRITAGNRVRLDIRDELELDPNAWHSLKVVHHGHGIRVMLGGVRVFDERDRRADQQTGEGGRVGVIATGGSEIWFDDLRVESKRGHRP